MKIMNVSLTVTLLAGLALPAVVAAEVPPIRDHLPAVEEPVAERGEIISDAPPWSGTGLSLRELMRARVVLDAATSWESPAATPALSLAQLHAVRLTETVSDAPSSPSLPRRPAAASWKVAHVAGEIVAVP